MRTVRIGLAGIASLADLYAALQRELDLPGHFGSNLDALWDALTTDLPGPIRIELVGTSDLRRRLGPDADRLLDLFIEAAAERDDFAVTLLA